jgi:hypothetical protein
MVTPKETNPMCGPRQEEYDLEELDEKKGQK